MSNIPALLSELQLRSIPQILTEMLSYTFLVRALVVGLLVSLCASLLGVSLVLKRYSMIGSGLSNVGFGSLAIATALNLAPLTVSVPVVVFAAFLLLRISENSKIKGDAAIALISTSSLAIGVIIISKTTGMNTDVCNYMFGSILSMSKSDVRLSIFLSITVLILFILFYNNIFAVTFDETFACATGTKANLYNMLIALLTAVTIVLGMRMMGAMLISSLIIFPALTSMRVCKTFRSVIICSAILSEICFFFGIIVSYEYAYPTGASIVVVNLIALLLFSGVALLRRRPAKMRCIPLFIVICTLLLNGCKVQQGAVQRNEAIPILASSSAADTGEAQEESAPDSSLSHSILADRPDGDVVEINEKVFIALINDIYLNPDEYIGRTLKYEGLYQSEVWEYLGPEGEIQEEIHYVIRYGPGCCGSDENAGFEIVWDGEYPQRDDWVEVTGELTKYEFGDFFYLQVRLDSLTVMEERGAETVLF